MGFGLGVGRALEDGEREGGEVEVTEVSDFSEGEGSGSEEGTGGEGEARKYSLSV